MLEIHTKITKKKYKSNIELVEINTISQLNR